MSNKFDCLIGYTGYVGTTLLLDTDFNYLFNSKNIKDIINRTYDTVICCGVSAKKWMANKEPEKDLESINSLLKNLKGVKCKKFVLVSTIDVYDMNTISNESLVLNSENCAQHPYGKNRLLVEEFVKENFDYLIVRLPALFGYGLKKNLIYDLINNNFGANSVINLNDSFQWYWTHDLSNDIRFCLTQNYKEVNLFTEPITNRRIIELFNKYGKIKVQLVENKSIVKYEQETNKKNKYWQTKEYIDERLESYFKIMLQNKLCLTSLVTPEPHSSKIFEIAKSMFSIKLIEVAPYSYFGKDFIDKPLTYFSKYKEKNIYSFQALLYPIESSIYDNDVYIIKYIKKLIDIATYLGVKIMVFGSPKNRCVKDRREERTVKFIEIMQKIGDYCEEKNVILCVEPNSKYYGNDFITDSGESLEILERINKKNICFMLDTGNMELEKEEILDVLQKNIGKLKHIHISSVGMKPLIDREDKIYNKIYMLLEKEKYESVITIEMLKVSELETLRSVYNLVKPA